MGSRSLQQVLFLHKAVTGARRRVLTRFWGMSIAKTARISLRANLDKTYPRGVHVGDYSYITFDVTILTHDRTRGIFTDTVIGDNCFIGAGSIIMPGVTVGDGCVIGAGSVVTKDIPAASVAAGNPARVLRSSIVVGRYGRYPDADDVTHRLIAEGKYVQ